MPRLIIRLHGKEVGNIDLAEKLEWRAGRSENSDIILQKETGISRDHFILRNESDQWIVEVMSKYGKLIHDGEEVTHLRLTDQSRFIVPPYEFQFGDLFEKEQDESDISGVDPSEPSQHLPQVQQPGALSRIDDDDDFSGNDEKTQIGSLQHHPYIKVLDKQNNVSQVLRLEGNFWVAGRDPANAILIDDNRVSRQQFEITKQGESYYIRDLGSVNGTMINSNLIATNEPTPLISGDSISVLENHLIFELRDSEFQHRLQSLPLATANPFRDGLPYMGAPQVYDQFGRPIPYEEPPAEGPEVSEAPSFVLQLLGPDRKTQIIRGALVGALLLGGIFYVADMMSQETGQATSTENDPLAGLTPEQQSLVKHTYELAKNLFMQGKHELAAAEIAKVHELTPEYLDSREIEELTQRSFELNKQKELIERQARDAQEMEEKIQAVAAECREMIDDNITSEAIVKCLSPGMQLNPEHKALLDIQQEVELRIQKRQDDSLARQERQRLVQKSEGMYQTARRRQNRGDLLGAIAAYKRFLDSGLPDPSGKKAQARKNIASIRASIDKKVETAIAQSATLRKEGKLREAVMLLDEAIKVEPGNEAIVATKNEIIADLQRDLRVLYQESILEESLGKISAAKDRWNLIKARDIPEGEYYQKAAAKLSRYGDF